MKIISEFRKQVIRDLHDRCGYSINKIKLMFSEGKISKPTIIKILRNIEKEDLPADDFNNDQTAEIEVNSDTDKQISEVSISDQIVDDDEFVVVGNKTYNENDRQSVKNDIIYNDWTTARFNNFLNENKSIIKKYNESQIWDIATSMTIAAKNRKITEGQMKTVIKELYKHTDKLSLENITKAVDICKNQKLI